MHTYETLFVSAPTLTEEEERTSVEGFSRVVAEGGGNLVASERMGRRRLAYPIRKHADGVYVRFLYDAEPAVPKELERRLRLADSVLRALTVRLEPKWAVAAKEQAVRDAAARAEAAERERLDAERGITPTGVAGVPGPDRAPRRPDDYFGEPGDDADRDEED